MKKEQAILRLNSQEITILKGALHNYGGALTGAGWLGVFDSLLKKVKKAEHHIRNRRHSNDRLYQMEETINGNY
jgi:hypothetical protein